MLPPRTLRSATALDIVRALSRKAKRVPETGQKLTPEGFEPPTFGSGIRRAAIAPWSRTQSAARSPSHAVIQLSPQWRNG